jgi:propanol-preferring alcohol dehydrogenase
MDADVTIVGLAGGTLPFTMGALPWDASLTMPYWGTQVELIEVLDLARAGLLHAHVERFPLDRVEEVYERLREGAIDGRAVVVPAAA